jgi:hypothetical protein
VALKEVVDPVARRNERKDRLQQRLVSPVHSSSTPLAAAVAGRG